VQLKNDIAIGKIIIQINMNKAEKFNIGLGIANVFILLITIAISIFAIKSNELIALNSGSYDKGKINISLGGFFIESGRVYDIYYGFENLSDSILHLTNYPLGIHSEGKKTVENVSLHFKYPHMMEMAVDDTLIQLNDYLTNSVRIFQTAEPYDQILYKIKSIDPGLSLGIGDIFVARESIGEVNVDAKTADNYDVSVLVNYEFAFKTQVTLTGKDIDALYYDFNLKFHMVSNLDELILKIAPNIRESILSKKNNRNYFFVVMPTIRDEIKTDLGVINMSHSKDDNTFLCVFDNSLETISVKSQSGKEIKQVILNKGKKE
jgi:hypothetical protein